jgi:hypothetical protein
VRMCRRARRRAGMRSAGARGEVWAVREQAGALGSPEGAGKHL